MPLGAPETCSHASGIGRSASQAIDTPTALGRLSLVTGLSVRQSDVFHKSRNDAQQSKDQLVGSWIFVSSTTKAEDGSPAWGTNPKGLVIFTASGRYSTHLLRSDRPKFASNSRLKGTPEENKAAVHGNVSIGTYTVDEANKTFTIRFEGSTYPNLEGTVQTRPFEIAGDELRVTNPAPTAGGPRGGEGGFFAVLGRDMKTASTAAGRAAAKAPATTLPPRRAPLARARPLRHQSRPNRPRLSSW